MHCHVLEKILILPVFKDLGLGKRFRERLHKKSCATLAFNAIIVLDLSVYRKAVIL